ncbi:transferrin-like [Zerene cesonia]|uniref:transferrin-like n=1 Tax=Zerene cesonia TaxID=33412 RepID=UPI0018E4F8F3|nr:transferrin-like [Zerene cesonia]
MESLKLLILCSFVKFVLLQGVGSGSNGNLRLCIVEGRGAYKRGAKFCPVLDAENSGMECVLGTDRLDCLRRISKGTVDFGAFSPEDLIAAQWADLDVLVTHELRHRQRDYERTVVAVVNRKILPDHPWSLDAVLRNTTLCHPGNGINDLRPLSDTLSGYLESLVVTRSCDPQLSLTENRIKAVANFFGKACKAGYWVPDFIRDAELKEKYPSLCAACESSCSLKDRYWGASGALSCLLDGAGDVMWGELDDVIAYFGLNTNSSMYPSSDNFAYLCRDGTWQPLKDNPNPCVWLNRPWPVIIAKRKTAAAVAAALSTLSSGALFDGRWRGALAALLEAREAPAPRRPPAAPLDHLAAAAGFREAYSQSGCRPPRHVTLCTTSLLARNKCEWLSEAGAVYGAAPALQCAARRGAAGCLQALARRDADVAVLPADYMLRAVREFDLSPVLYEVTPIVEKMNTVVAYVKKSANINKMADLRGRRAAFPRYDGFAWQSVMDYLSKKHNCDDILNNYFSEICAPGIEKYNLSETIVNRFTKSCYQNGGEVDEEKAALMSVVDGHSDVAFISMKTFNLFKAEQISSGESIIDDIVPLCPDDNVKYCYLSWANIGHIYAPKNISDMRRHEIKNVFTKLDQLFGKHQPFHNPMFSIFGPFNHQLDVIFHNNTKSLASEELLEMHPYVTMPFNFERRILNNTLNNCQITDQMNSAPKLTSSLFLIVPTLVVFVLGK